MTLIELFVLCLILLVPVLLLILRLKNRLSDKQIRDYLAQGAWVVDVRSPEEFQQARVEGTLNIPLENVVEGVQATTDDQSQVLLLHCKSGGRSAIATSRLRRAGYRNSYNLGSFNRAAALLAPDQ